MADNEPTPQQGEDEKKPNFGSPLPFPLDEDTIFSLTNGGFVIAGRATMADGQVVITDRRIKPSSVAIVSYHEIILDADETVPAILEGKCGDGTLTITSYDSTMTQEPDDDSTVSYLIILAAKAT